jgi:hypothetical protein
MAEGTVFGVAQQESDLREAKIGVSEISEGQVMTKFVQNPTKAHPEGRRVGRCRAVSLAQGTLSGHSPAGLNPIEYGNAGRLDGGTSSICLRTEHLSGYTG